MRKHIVGAVCLVLLSVANLIAQPDSTYFRLVSRAKTGDTTVDYTQMRMSYTETDLYSPYGGRAYMDSARKAMDKKEYAEAMNYLNEELERNFVNIDAHFMAFFALRRLEDTARADRHKYFYQALIKSVLASGDGSAESPWTVISTKEEYAVINYYNLKFKKQTLRGINGHSCDVMETIDPETREEYTLHFNVDIPLKSMSRLLKKE